VDDARATTALQYMPALDGLRAVAVGGVIAFHAGHLRGGFLGVDLFFVLSGFLITSLLVKEWAERGRVDLVSFWTRRARRLLPAVLFMLSAVSAYAAWLAEPVEIERIREDAIATLLYFANWRAVFAAHSYWDLFGAPSPLHHTWSLAIEEQFYLAWPLLVAALLKKGGPRAVGVASAVLAAASVMAMALCFSPEDSSRAYYGTDTRAAALCLGAVLAVMPSQRRHPRSPRARRMLELGAGLVALALAAFWALADGHAAFLYRGGLLASQVAVVVLLAAASHPEPGWLARALSVAPLRYLGQLSYGLYLWHWPVIVAVSESRLGVGGAPLLGLRLAATLALAAASYHAIELPIRRSALRGWRMALIAPAAFAAVTGLVLIGAAEGASRRPAPAAVDAPWLDERERARAAALPLRVAVVGDSVAQRIAEAMGRVDLALEVENGGAAGCGLFEGARRYRRPDGKVIWRGQECGAVFERWSAQARGRDAALLVLGPPVLGEWEIAGRFTSACDPAFDEDFAAQAARGLEALGGARAVFVASMPYGLGDEWGARERERCDCLNAALAGATAAHGGELVDLASYVCPGGSCRARVGGIVLRSDGLHFDGAGGELVAWWLASSLRDVLGDPKRGKK
jgi:peptidoglycan/LPS O-acetylase OafA/YrhL